MHILLASDTTFRALRRPLAKACKDMGLQCSFSVSEYAIYELLNPACIAYQPAPDLCILSLHLSELTPTLARTTTLLGPVESRRMLCQAVVDDVIATANALLANTAGAVLVDDFPVPDASPLGIRDTSVELSLRACV